MISPEAQELWDTVFAVYDARRLDEEVGPSSLATEVMRRIEFPSALHRLGYTGCHLQVRQMARSFCRLNFDPVDSSKTDGDLFPETLQDRYPKRPKPGVEPVYILRHLLSADDRSYNVTRMRRASAAMLKHADALEAEGRLLALLVAAE